MKTQHKYLALTLVTALSMGSMSIGVLTSAQTVTPLVCTTGSATVNQSQPTVLTATGGNGSYVWSGPNLNVTNATGNQFSVSYPNAGTYTITVTSAGLSAPCTFTVVPSVTSGALTCMPASQNVTLGQTASVVASGGSGTYTWSSPELNVTNANGTNFNASYASIGLKTLTVTSGGVTASCVVNVLAGSVTPGLPNTGGGYNQ